MKTITTTLMAALLVAGTAACGGGAATTGGPKTPGGPTDANGQQVTEAAANKFKAGLDAMTQHDKANDWSDATCTSTAQLFLDAAKEQGDKTFNEAVYDAGVSHQRCKKDNEAKALFKQVLDKDSKFHRARVQLALYAFAESGEKDIEGALKEMKQAVTDAQYQNVEALVYTAMFQMKRNSQSADDDGANDLERARKNLQRALAVDDTYMPAFNQLALYYLEAAKQKAGRQSTRRVAIGASKKEKKVDTQALDLAELVTTQAIRKNGTYAPIFNTAGMIKVELGNLNSAVQAFNTARKLDPSFYEAQMNFAAVNLQFRGFEQAEEAYRAALKMRPNDYDAHLGLALALRGGTNDSNFDKNVPAAAAELEAAKKIAPDRPEAYYNDAILTQEYKAKSGGSNNEVKLNDAKGLFAQFIQKAGSDAGFADAVKRSKERMTEIDQIIAFNKQTEAERKAAEADMKQKEAEAMVNGQGGEAAGGDPNAKPDDKPADDKKPEDKKPEDAPKP
jgi:tetratricopeptide (TPR) repeat protein